MNKAFAHLREDKTVPHLLHEHLVAVAKGAMDNAVAACPRDTELAALAYWAGLLHDLGKYRLEFQEYLAGHRKKSLETQHAVFGAAGARSKRLPSAVWFAIMGHHAGLPNWSDLKDHLKNSQLSPQIVSKSLLEQLERDLESLAPFPATNGLREYLKRGVDGFFTLKLEDELRVRMLFSCLVDADYLDTEQYMSGRGREVATLDPALLFSRLEAYVQSKATAAQPSRVNEVRARLYQDCLRAAERPRGCYRLTAPTGSGKTLSAMAFALKHAQRHGLRRVIVVLPFLAIIEQNAQVYRQSLGAIGEDAHLVVEHHSAVAGMDDGDEERSSLTRERAKQATENWDAPVIVTTAVQFLESLFSRRPGRCRKLHNIAQSVVIFDEVQTLPFPLLDPILSVIRDLQNHFGVSFLLSSATTPHFEKSGSLRSGFPAEACKEVVENPEQAFQLLKRVKLELPYLTEGRWSWAVLAERLENTPRALIIVNLRKHAQKLYDALKKAGVPGLFHLSSTMCPAHRRDVLGDRNTPEPGTIYHALAERNAPCVVVSTQVVEAGVDLDFPVVYRAIAPLDAIIQAAGRCNREGKLTDDSNNALYGRVIIFEPDDGEAGPPGYYKEATTTALNVIGEHANSPSEIVDNPVVYAEYHHKLIKRRIGYHASKSIQESRGGANFPDVDQQFKLIDQAGQGVVVPYARASNLVESIRKQGYLTLKDRRELQRYMVNLYPTWIETLGASVRPLIGTEAGPLIYEGPYDAKGVGLRVIELPADDFACW